MMTATTGDIEMVGAQGTPAIYLFWYIYTNYLIQDYVNAYPSCQNQGQMMQRAVAL